MEGTTENYTQEQDIVENPIENNHKGENVVQQLEQQTMPTSEEHVFLLHFLELNSCNTKPL